MAALIFATLLCAGWLVPDHFPPWWAFHNEAPVFAGLVLAWVAVWAQHRKLIIEAGSAQLVLLLLMGLAVLQYLAGQLLFAGDVWLTLVYGGGFALAWLLGQFWAGERRRSVFDPLETLALGFSAGASVSALLALTQWLQQEQVWGAWITSASHTSRVLANLGQPNQLATLVLMGLVATAILRQREKISLNFFLTLVVLNSVALVLTQSRTGVLSASLLALWFLWKGGSADRLSRWGMLAWVGSIWLGTWLYQSVGSMGERAVLGEQVLQVGLRPLMWKQLLQALSLSPLTGYGWLQTAAAQQAGAFQVPGLEQVSYAHNHMLDLALWIGVPLTLLVLGVLGRIVWARRHAVSEPRVFLLTAWLLPLLNHAMLEFPLAYAYFLLPAGVMLGMLNQWTKPAGAQGLQLRRWGMPLIVSVYAALLWGVAVDYMRAEEDFRIARFENRGIGQTPADYTAPDLKLLTQLGTVLHAMRLRAAPDMKPEEVELLRLASGRYSWAPLHFRYALALALNGQPELAARQMQLVKSLYGEKMYADALTDFHRLQQERYPQLGLVQLPY